MKGGRTGGDTHQLPDPGDDNYPVSDSGTGYPGPDAAAGATDTQAGLHADDNTIYTGVHASNTRGHPDRDAG